MIETQPVAGRKLRQNRRNISFMVAGYFLFQESRRIVSCDNLLQFFLIVPVLHAAHCGRLIFHQTCFLCAHLFASFTPCLTQTASDAFFSAHRNLPKGILGTKIPLHPDHCSSEVLYFVSNTVPGAMADKNNNMQAHAHTAPFLQREKWSRGCTA